MIYKLEIPAEMLAQIGMMLAQFPYKDVAPIMALLTEQKERQDGNH